MSDFQSKIIEVKHLVTEVTDLFIKQKTVLDSMSETISKFGKGAKLPSDFLSAQKEVIANEKALIAQATKKFAIDKQAEQLKQQQLITAQKEANAKKAILALAESERKSQILTSKESERQALANKKLSDAYGQLSKRRNDAARALQNSIIETGKYSSETKKLQKNFNELNSSVSKADKAIGKFSQANSGIKALTGSVSALMGAFGISTGIYLAIDIAKNIYETTKQLQSLDLALKMVSDTQDKYASNTEFLRNISEKWGLEIKSTTETFTKFYADAKGKLSEAQIKETFEGISKAGSVMGLSLEKQKSAFTAFQQMLSKGTIQAQELKLQLGDALPGSIKVATQAYQKLHPELKVTEQLLYKEMEAGKLISSEMIPLMVKGYQELYGIERTNSIDTLAASQNRLQNSWTALVRSMNESETGGLSVFFKVLAGGLTNGLKLLTRYNSEWEILNKQARSEGNEFGFNEFKLDGKSKEQLKKDKDYIYLEAQKLSAKIVELNKKFRQEGFFSEINPFSDTGAEIEKLTKEKGQMEGAIRKINSILQPESKLKPNIPNQTTEELEKQRKAREKRDRENKKSEQDRLALIEKNAKTEYDLKISNLNREKEIIKDLRDDKETSLEDMLFLEQAYGFKEMQIALAVYEEEVRLAGKSESMQTIALNKFLTEKENLIKESLDRQSKFTLDFNEEQRNKTKEWYKNNPPIGIFDTEANKKDREESEQELKDALKARIKIFNDYVGDFANKSGFGESFDLMTKINPKTGKSLFESMVGKDGKAEWEDYFMGITTIAQDAFNLINEASQQRFEREQQRLEKDKENALKFAGDNQLQKQRIEEEYEKRRKEIARKQWQAKKKQAIANILIDTAQAIVSTLAQQPGGLISKSVAAAVIGGLGLVQVGIVAAQKPPEFYVGTQNAPEGLAYTNERGAELHTDKKGNIKDFGDNKGARLTMLEAGDKIYTAEQTKRILFNDELNNILTSNNIMPSSINIQSNGVSATQMDAIIGKHFSNIQTNNTMIDKNGFNSWTEKNGNKTISDNNRIQRKGLIIKG